MEFYLAQDKNTQFYRDENMGQGSTVILEQGDIIPRDFQDGRSAVDVRNQQYIQLKECIGLLKKPEPGIENHLCRYCGHHPQMNRVFLDIFFT